VKMGSRLKAFRRAKVRRGGYQHASPVELDFQAKDKLMAIRVAVVTGSSSGSSNARDEAMATTSNDERVCWNDFQGYEHSRAPSALR
jgi:hypothetical protein